MGNGAHSYADFYPALISTAIRFEKASFTLGWSRSTCSYFGCFGTGSNLPLNGVSPGGGDAGAAAWGMVMMMGAGCEAGTEPDLGTALFRTKVMTVIAATPSRTAVATIHLIMALALSCTSTFVAVASSRVSIFVRRTSIARSSVAASPTNSSSFATRVSIGPSSDGYAPLSTARFNRFNCSC